MILVLHNIRSVYNVGSIFRTADAAGMSKIILSGYTPLPVDRFGLPRKDFNKVSLGAEKTVAWESTKTLASAIKKLKADGYIVAALELDKNAKNIFEYKPSKSASRRIALILGNEVRGISTSALAQCDVILEIPMKGKKESLNVSVAAGIAMFALIKKNQRK